MHKILIAGFGKLGMALSRELLAGGHRVWGLRRSAGPPADGIALVCGDLTRPETLGNLPGPFDFVFYAAAPAGGGDSSRSIYVDGPRNLLAALTRFSDGPRRFFLVSSTGVYGQQQGEWVDEATPPCPASPRAEILLEGERRTVASNLAVTIVRAGGIYGPGRTRLLEQVRKGKAECYRGGTRYSNRIHQDDLARVLRFLMEGGATQELYLAVDHDPAPRCQVMRWLAARIGAPPPAEVDAQGRASRTLRSNKRCRNERLLKSGFRFRYPTFREGYLQILAVECEQARNGVTHSNEE